MALGRLSISFLSAASPPGPPFSPNFSSSSSSVCSLTITMGDASLAYHKIPSRIGLCEGRERNSKPGKGKIYHPYTRCPLPPTHNWKGKSKKQLREEIEE